METIRKGALCMDQYLSKYASPLGNIMLTSDEQCLTGLWFENRMHHLPKGSHTYISRETPVLRQTKDWLDIYFSGKEPPFFPPLHLTGSDFQKEVWEILRRIPYGKTITYGDIAAEIAQKRGIKKMSAQAVGGAVGHNPVAVIVPCHRVMGAKGNLTGYTSGIDLKIALLKLEQK